MTYAGTADWLRDRLWIGWPVGAVAWVVWLGSVGYGGYSAGRPIDAEGTPVCVDHLAFYSAACLIRNGHAERMYDYDFLGPYQGELLGYDWGMLIGYRNPPFYALLYLPTTGLPFIASVVVWNLIGLGLLALSIRWLRPEHPGRVFLWALTFFPVFAVVSFGQNSLLSLAVFAATYRLLSDRRPFVAGLVAGLLWFKPQLLIGLFVWWAFASLPFVARSLRDRISSGHSVTGPQYRWCWAGVAVTGAVLAAVSWLAVPDGSRAFVDTLAANVGYGGEKRWNKQSPRAFWSLLLPGASAGVIWGLTLVTAGAAVAGAGWVSRRTAASVPAMFPVAVFLSLWVSPHTLIYEWALLVPAAVVLWERFPDRRDVWMCLFVVTWVVLAASTPLAKFQIDFLEPLPVVQIAVPVMGAVAGLTLWYLGSGTKSADVPNGPAGTD